MVELECVRVTSFHYHDVIFPRLYQLGMLSHMAILKVKRCIRCIGLGGMAFVTSLKEVSECPKHN